VLYLLDTCTFSYAEDADSPFRERILAALRALDDEDDVCLSILSIYELEYGLKLAEGTLKSDLELAKRKALTMYRALPLTRKGASIFADLKSLYRRWQEPQMAVKELAKHLARHTVDLMIASTAIEHGGTVVSNDQIFTVLQGIVPELGVADWTVKIS